jgi:prepilin-type N-terminal cleavage/methylation domain-containing protein/prepilin-type processing-associated H-X9-DG protein
MTHSNSLSVFEIDDSGLPGLHRIRVNRVDATQRAAFTLVEVLVVIAIIGVLVALLLPAVEMARESARRTECTNHLRQQAVAVKLHADTHQTFPTGGWGSQWVGDPDSGYGPKQPGGWIYNVLAYLEESTLRDTGKGRPAADKKIEIVKVLETPLAIFNCPSRRLPNLYPYTGPTSLENVDPPDKVAKSDYVINRDISSEKSEVILAEIQLRVGLSKTVMAGEKALAFSEYTTGAAAGDKLTMYAGDCDDIARMPVGNPVSDATATSSGFGSPHPGGSNIAYCDASVRFVTDDQELGPAATTP